MITFVVPINNEDIFRNNFLSSPLFISNNYYEIIEQRGFISASMAYNDAIKRAKNDIIVFLHQDVILPCFWDIELRRAITYLSKHDPSWGVVGCYGYNSVEKGVGFIYCVGNKKLLGNLSIYPIPARSLDEVILVIKKSTGLKFDNCLPHYHLYGTDICMTSASQGRNCYAISAFCLHNTNKVHIFPREFFECYKYIKNKWRNNLPIATTCIRIEKYDLYNYIENRYLRTLKMHLRNKLFQSASYNSRTNSPITLLSELEKQYKLHYNE